MNILDTLKNMFMLLDVVIIVLLLWWMIFDKGDLLYTCNVWFRVIYLLQIKLQILYVNVQSGWVY